MTQTLKAAQWYAKQGFSVIPILPPKADSKGKDNQKKPPISWLPYQTQQASQEEIEQWFTDKPDMRLGIVTGALSNLTVIDCDTPEAIEQIEGTLPDNFRVPIAISPRGGRHYYFQHEAQIPNKAGVAAGIDTRSEGGYIIAPPSTGLNGKGYSWLEGCKISDIEVPVISSSLLSFFLKTRASASGMPKRGNINISFDEPGRDQTLFHLAHHLVKSGMPEPNIMEFLLFFGMRCDPPYEEKLLHEKIKSALKRNEENEKSVTQEVREFLMVTKGNFRVTEVSQWVTRVTNNNKAILMALNRMVKDKLIEKLTSPGTYRIIDTNMESVNIKEVKSGEWMEFALPLGLEDYVKIAPGNLIIIAGVTNSGKSAVLFNMIKDNMKHRKTWYFSSEMSKETVKGRLLKGDENIDWDFEIVGNWDQNIDVLKEDDFNFIDWLEAGDEPYKIGDVVARIQQKMRKGIVVVAMQKNPGSDRPYGGYQTMSHASLCLSIDQDFPGAVMKVIKAKAFDTINPNGFMTKFKIVNGIKLIQSESWMPEIDEKYKSFKGKE